MIALAVLAALLATQPRDAHAEAQPSVASITGLPKRVALDAKRLFTTRTPALILAGGGLAALAVHPADHAVVNRLSSSPGLEDFLDGGALAGDGTVQGLTAIGVYGVGYAIRNERTKQVGTSLVEAQILNLVMTQGLKYAVNRERPDGGRYSFPSGHASATFVTADVLLQEFGPKAGVPAYAGAVYVAISRLSEKQHYPSDVVFGAAVGIACARTLDIRAHGHRFTVTPVPVPGGGAVFVQAVARH
jgi:membrane-associated phospholipid phosphatase